VVVGVELPGCRGEGSTVELGLRVRAVLAALLSLLSMGLWSHATPTFDEEENETEEQVGQAKGNLACPNEEKGRH
jgi:hypothetical protein